MSLELFAQQGLNGLVTGSFYALIAIGVTLVFGLTGIVNFAQGQFLLVGCYAALIAGTHSWPLFVLALTFATGLLTATGVVSERVLFGRTLDRPINGFVVSLGLVVISQGALAVAFGTNAKTLDGPISGLAHFGSLYAANMRLVAMALALSLAALFWCLLRYTKHGIALRACSVDRETAMLMGIPARRMITLAFAAGSALAGAGGALYATVFPFSPFIGDGIVVKAFVIALAGGLGSVTGALWISLLLGVGEAWLVGLGYGSWVEAVLFLVVILVLMLRPQGLFRGGEGSAVA